jgi:hypothetical protein
VEGISLPSPVSLVDEFQKTTNSTKPKPLNSTARSTSPSAKSSSSRDMLIDWLKNRSFIEIIALIAIAALVVYERNKR